MNDAIRTAETTSPTAVTRPRRLTPALAWALAWMAYTVALGALYVRLPTSPDAAVFDYIGWMALRGARLYVDVGEQNFPGQMWIHMAATALFGNTLWSFRLFDYLLTILGAAALAGLLLRDGRRLAALVVVPLYQSIVATGNLWVSGQRDLVAALFLAAAGLAYHVRRRGRSRLWVWAFAALAVAAVLIRPTYALFCPILLLADYATERDRARRRTILGDAAAAAAISASILALVGLAFSRTGALSAWYDQTVLFNREMYSQSHSLGQITLGFLSMVTSWHWYLAFGLLGAWLWFREGRDRLVGLVLASLVLTSLASAYIQGKGFGYHVAGLLPPLAALGAWFIAWSVDGARARPTRLRQVIALAVCGVAVAGVGLKIWSGRRAQLQFYMGTRSERELLATYEAGLAGFSMAEAADAAALIRESTSPGDTVLTWSRALQVNFLAGRASPSRFPTVGMLELAREPFSRARAWTEELRQALAQRPPAVILVPAPGAGDDACEVWQQASPSGPVLVLRQALREQYVLERHLGSMDLYRLRG